MVSQPASQPEAHGLWDKRYNSTQLIYTEKFAHKLLEASRSIGPR